MANVTRSVFLLLLLLSGCGWDGTPTRHNDFVPLTSIEISAVSAAIVAQTSIRLTVKGYYSGLFTRDDITDQAVWSSGSPDVADFVTTTDRARVTGLKPGTATLTATVGSVTSTFVLTVSPGTVTALTITPLDPTIAKGQEIQFAATGTFSDLPPREITFDVAWSSSAPAVAPISNTTASKGSAQAIAAGTSTVTATFGAVSGSTLLTVTEPVLKSMALSPANPTILTLSTRSFTATGTYSDGSTANITSQITWSSSDPDIATVANDGTAKGLTQGTTTIRAARGSISQSTNLKVTGGNLTGIAISLTPPTLIKGTSGRIAAKGTFSNGRTRDITGAVEWKVADTSRATVTTAGGTLAWLKALEVTSATIVTATSGSLAPATATLAVTAPAQLLSVALSPKSLELTAGTSSPLTVIATFTGGTTQDVATSSVWESNNGAIATVGASGLAAGRVTGVTTGGPAPAISATYTYNGITHSDSATVTVKSRTLQSLAISPETSTVSTGSQVLFKVMASYIDGTVVDVTTDPATTWAIDNENVATLVDSQDQPGQVIAVDSGSSATLTAGFGGKPKTAKITTVP